MAIVMITHDLGVVAGMAERVHVMYAGRLVETGPTEALFRSPAHPYTSGLLGSVPTLAGDPGADLHAIPGQPPDLARLPRGCAFAERCGLAKEGCRTETPDLAEVSRERRSACLERETLLAGSPEVRP